MKSINKKVAIAFGRALDQDDFDQVKQLLSPKCTYHIGNEVHHGPEAIAGSYEQNMIEGRKKLDELIWGDSRIERVDENEYLVHFTDYLTHNGKKYIHRCSQAILLDVDGSILTIKHLDDPEEQSRLQQFYQSVGL